MGIIQDRSFLPCPKPNWPFLKYSNIYTTPCKFKTSDPKQILPQHSKTNVLKILKNKHSQDIQNDSLQNIPAQTFSQPFRTKIFTFRNNHHQNIPEKRSQNISEQTFSEHSRTKVFRTFLNKYFDISERSLLEKSTTNLRTFQDKCSQKITKQTSSEYTNCHQNIPGKHFQVSSKKYTYSMGSFNILVIFANSKWIENSSKRTYPKPKPDDHSNTNSSRMIPKGQP